MKLTRLMTVQYGFFQKLLNHAMVGCSQFSVLNASCHFTDMVEETNK
uniref:Uncharacterized protein n=1 Tax=Rhizophora mucronata TaxID=61149 RepID=A0A2P2IJN1_RHIMU